MRATQEKEERRSLQENRACTYLEIHNDSKQTITTLFIIFRGISRRVKVVMVLRELLAFVIMEHLQSLFTQQLQ